MAQSTATWRLVERAAHLQCGPLEAKVEFRDESPTFFPLKWAGRHEENFAMFMALALDKAHRANGLVLLDKYVRGNDLVATFAKIAPHQVSPQTYWRTKLCGDRAVSVEFLISAQTDLLDSDPRFQIGSFGMETSLFQADSLSDSAFEELRRPDDSQPTEVTDFSFDQSESALRLFVFRSKYCDLSYAEMVHPSDFSSVNVYSTPESPWFVNWMVFPERLEKGVIRRARICGWFMPAENDLATAVELAKRFVDEPPPLTT